MDKNTQLQETADFECKYLEDIQNQNDIAYIIIKCLAKTKNEIDSRLLAEILFGSNSKEIIDNNLQENEFYGSLNNMHKNQILNMIEQLLNNDYVEIISQETTQVPDHILHVTQKGKDAVIFKENISFCPSSNPKVIDNNQLAHEALHKFFGYSSFLPLQKEIIKGIFQKNDVFALIPTGGGKSLCYQIPALVLDGITIVVSPLIALMKDQVDALRTNGVQAAYINSSLSSEQINQVKLELRNGVIKILYVAPERIVSSNFFSFLKSLDINLVAIDEAHCISEWGHDFRPGYRQLKIFKEQMPNIPLIAMTATAIPEVQQDIITELKLSNPKCYKASLNRKNLYYQVRPKKKAYQQILEYLDNHKNESGIIYCQSRKDTEKLANNLRSDGYDALPYHAGLSSNLRTESQEKFVKDDVRIIVATIAFGMGIDKSNIRFVIHYDLPKNLESYYQETGRAGRDGEQSDCILFYGYNDKRKIEYFIREKENEMERVIATKKLQEIVKFCESAKCRRKMLLNYFGEEYTEDNCNGCDSCLEPKEMIDGTIIAQKTMSCISQTGERFGISYIADILYGSKKRNIINNRHDEIECYGTGKEYSRKQWQIYLRELVNLDYLRIEGDYPILKINPKMREDLTSHKTILLTKAVDNKKILRVESKQKYDHGLFEKLRELRKTVADYENVPPYVVFHDSTLKAMAFYSPRNRTDFLKLSGVSETKLEKYGSIFLKEIKKYCAKHDIEPVQRSAYRKSTDKIGSTLKTTLNLFNQNLSIEEIAERRKLVPSTIASHLEKLIKAGEEIPIDRVVSKAKQEIIRKTLSSLGDEALKPIKEELGDDYSYGEIRFVRAYERQKSRK